MSTSNRERVGKVIDLLQPGLMPFVEREMRVKYGDQWADNLSMGGRPGGANALDSYSLLMTLWDQWQNVFRCTLGPFERSLVSEMRDWRNKWAHQEPFTTSNTLRVMDSAARLLEAVAAGEAQEVRRLQSDLSRQFYEEQSRKEVKRVVVAPTETQTVGGLAPWRDVIQPHDDVATGRFQQAEFAADLWQVYVGEGVAEYRDPSEFFKRTFLTEGLKLLLKGAIQRICGNGGDPVVELQTNFGGGKTHSMLALYHLFGGTDVDDLAGAPELLKAVGITKPLPHVNRAVLVGQKISPGQKHIKPDGTVVRTLWGELAYQLGGAEGYALVAEADQTATSPGDALRVLFNKYAPCLILIDEWVRYACQLHDDNALPGGSFDTHFTFAQTLTEAAKSANNTFLVVSIPASEIEQGGDRGRAALQRLKNAVGRVEAPWRPASAEEGFEIVRRRLFQPITEDQNFAIRDVTARKFSEMYRSDPQEFPLGCNEADYERRIKAAYPIHPELFDRLYQDWSSLDKFQRTRGVLRLMAAVIHELWSRGDSRPLIMPGSIPIDAPPVQAELTHYLEDQWVPVIEKDVDGEHSLPWRMEQETPSLARNGVCRRVARTIYIGSAPTLRTSHRGLEDRQIRLGCMQPGESIGIFGDALRRLTDQATHLYVDGKRYWYNTQPSVSRLAQDRAAQQTEDDVADEIKKLLSLEKRQRGDFTNVYPAPASSLDVPDERETRLVIFGPEQHHSRNAPNSPARKLAAEYLRERGLGQRNYLNSLVFLAPDQAAGERLRQAVRQLIAWRSIDSDKDTLNLDSFQLKQIATKLQQANDSVRTLLVEAYCWLLVPGQAEPRVDAPITWEELQLKGQDGLAVRASKRLKSEDGMLTLWAGSLLKMELDRIPLWRGDHVSIRQLVDDFASYLYLPRLRDTSVLLDAMIKGVHSQQWEQETFAYADEWDDIRKRYVGLTYAEGKPMSAESRALLVKPEVAARQIIAEKPAALPPEQPAYVQSGNGLFAGVVAHDPAAVSQTGNGPAPIPSPSPAMPSSALCCEFHGSIQVSAGRLNRDAASISSEVIQHLASLLGSEVEITIEVHARVPDGISPKVVSTIKENCRTLKFMNCQFE